MKSVFHQRYSTQMMINDLNMKKFCIIIALLVLQFESYAVTVETTANLNMYHPKYSKIDLVLTSFGAYAIDKETGEEGLTLAGLLMFGTGLAVRERLSNFRMDYVDMSHLVGDERYHDRLTYDGRWENNVYQFMKLVLPKFTIDLPRPFRMEGIKRVDDTPQHKAVREAFTNAIIHADVFLPGGVLRIDKYDDRLVLRNPGTLRLPIEKIYEGGTSRARNPRIQNMLRMIGYGENLGSGFPMIVSAWKDAGWGVPLLKNQIELDEVELSLPVQNNIKLTKDYSNENKRIISDVLKNVLKNVLKEDLEKLSERQINILEIIVQTPTITYKEMSKRLNVSVKTIQRDYTAIGLLGINIVRKNGKTYGEWVIES